MDKAKRLVLAAVVAVAGFLLVLSGLNLVQLSGTLSLYIGIMLLVVAGMVYLLP